MTVTNIGTPQVANRGFVPLAVEAGIIPVIESLVGLAVDKKTLLIDVVKAIKQDNKQLSESLNYQTLDAILLHMESLDAGVVEASDLPVLLDEDGPASVTAGWDGDDPGSEQINVTYSEPPVDYTAEIYLDGVYAKHSTVAASVGFCNDSVTDVTVAISTVRVLFRSADGSQSRFGPIADM